MFLALLFLLCIKSIMLIKDMRTAQRDRAYRRWKFVNDITSEPDDEKLILYAKLHGITINHIDAELYDADGSLKSAFGHDLINDDDDTAIPMDTACKVSLSALCLLFIAYAATLSVLRQGALFIILRSTPNQ